MTKLSVSAITGPYCATYTQGEQLFAQVAQHLRAGAHVQLDFADVEFTSSSFFNEFFGSILEKFGEETLSQCLSFVSLRPRHRFVLDRTRYATPV
ncbi:MAG: STAS-like domain-containing protein [Nitrospira sp.]|jgi:chromosome condensin MukBEF MukE localization factor|nr:STAS-like domain-containing protein [Nitrospira sp.]MBL8054355.1 STAS-like domain-containing protein [Nitrospira sp.]